MITPRFSCTQTEDSVAISIYCPSIRASEVQIHVDETLFTLHVNPYFLRLNFSGSLLEDDASLAKYDAGSGYFTVTLTKEVKGMEFQDLDLLAKLLAPRRSDTTPSQPSIEVINSEATADLDEDELVDLTQGMSLSSEQQEILRASENDWELPQSISENLLSVNLTTKQFYGFLDHHHGYFKHVAHVENEVNDLGYDAENYTPPERRTRRLAREDTKWDEEHYMADYADDEYIQELIHWKHPHLQLSSDFDYTEAENLIMLRLPRKEYLPTHQQTHGLYLTLLSLLFSYAYESRTNQLDPTPESAWTLSILTPAFCALDPPPYSEPEPRCTLQAQTFLPVEIESTLKASYRRSLAFPLYRSFALAEACTQDVAAFLSAGRRLILRCLLEVKDILDHHDVYYVYSKIWADDFCVWIQTGAEDDTLQQLGELVRSSTMSKGFIGWDLEGLEAATRSHQPREERDSDDE